MLQSILLNPDVLSTLVFCAAALAGQFLHGVKKWSEGHEWFTVNPRRTVGAIIGNIGGMIVFIQLTPLTALMALPNGVFAVTMFGFMNGFVGDSALNRGVKKPDEAPTGQ